MVWTRLLPALLVAALILVDPARGQDQQARQLSRTIPVTMDYLLYLPKDYASREAWPLLLFLHGAGERGDDLELVKKHGPPRLIEEGRNFPFIVVSPQCPEDQRWQPLKLDVLVDEIVEKYNVDEERIYVSGLSMGGFGAWSLAALRPDRFAALVPICGGGEKQWAKDIAHLPIWVFHGAKDEAVPLERSEEMVEALRHEGGQPKVTIYPDLEHDSWTETYDNPELYHWLLQQKRKERPPSD